MAIPLDSDEKDECELNRVLGERYARWRGNSDANEIVFGGVEIIAKLVSSSAFFDAPLDNLNP